MRNELQKVFNKRIHDKVLIFQFHEIGDSMGAICYLFPASTPLLVLLFFPAIDTLDEC